MSHEDRFRGSFQTSQPTLKLSFGFFAPTDVETYSPHKHATPNRQIRAASTFSTYPSNLECGRDDLLQFATVRICYCVLWSIVVHRFLRSLPRDITL